MQKTIYSVAALTPALLIAGGFNQPLKAEGIPQNVRVQQLYAFLQGAVCSNDWHQSLSLTNSLIGSPEISANYRQQLVEFRHQVESWRAAKSEFSNNPNCERSVSERQEIVNPSPSDSGTVQTDSQSARVRMQDVRIQQLYAALQEAVCRNDWNQALRVITPLTASPEISPAYRQQLVQFRHQLEGWRAARALIENTPNCNTVSLARGNDTSTYTVHPAPEEFSHMIDWAS